MKKKKPVPELPKKTDNRPIESVVFIPYTKGGRLQKELQSKDDSFTQPRKNSLCGESKDRTRREADQQESLDQAKWRLREKDLLSLQII